MANILMPVMAGLILYFVWRGTHPEAARYARKVAVLSIATSVVVLAVLGALPFMISEMNKH